MDFFAPYRKAISDLCKQHQVRSLYAFGSAVKGTMHPGSDVDLMLDLPIDDPDKFAEHYWSLEEDLEKLFDRKVGLVSRRAVRNTYFLELVDAYKVKLYEA